MSIINSALHKIKITTSFVPVASINHQYFTHATTYLASTQLCTLLEFKAQFTRVAIVLQRFRSTAIGSISTSVWIEGGIGWLHGCIPQQFLPYLCWDCNGETMWSIFSRMGERRAGKYRNIVGLGIRTQENEVESISLLERKNWLPILEMEASEWKNRFRRFFSLVHLQTVTERWFLILVLPLSSLLMQNVIGCSFQLSCFRSSLDIIKPFFGAFLFVNVLC